MDKNIRILIVDDHTVVRRTANQPYSGRSLESARDACLARFSPSRAPHTGFAANLFRSAIG